MFACPEFVAAKKIFFYASFDGEVATPAMIKDARQLGKTIALPKIEIKNQGMIPIYVDNPDEELERGPYGILQPCGNAAAPLKDLDLCVVPGIAFDRDNHRLGRGGGYYDRFLSAGHPRFATIGLAFEFQLLDRLPVDAHDQRVGRVLTN